MNYSGEEKQHLAATHRHHLLKKKTRCRSIYLRARAWRWHIVACGVSCISKIGNIVIKYVTDSRRRGAQKKM